MATITHALKSMRESKGLTQREIARRVGIDASHLSRIEAGRLSPQLSTLVELARALDMELMLVPRAAVTAVRSLLPRAEPRGRRLSEAPFPAITGSREDQRAYRLPDEEDGDDPAASS